MLHRKQSRCHRLPAVNQVSSLVWGVTKVHVGSSLRRAVSQCNQIREATAPWGCSYPGGHTEFECFSFLEDLQHFNRVSKSGISQLGTGPANLSTALAGEDIISLRLHRTV